MLTRQLRELEENNIVNRKSYNIVPPKVEYSLSSIGLELLPILEQLKDWGIRYNDNNSKFSFDLEDDCSIDSK